MRIFSVTVDPMYFFKPSIFLFYVIVINYCLRTAVGECCFFLVVLITGSR